MTDYRKQACDVLNEIHSKMCGEPAEPESNRLFNQIKTCLDILQNDRTINSVRQTIIENAPW